MNSQNQNDLAVGLFFESVAERILKEKGHKILERNYKCGKYEIDLISKNEDKIIFVEVKSRKEGSLLPPESAVDTKKMKNILYAASGFIKSLKKDGIDPHKLSYGFDVVAITYDENYNLKSVKHFADFYKGEKDELLRFAL